MKAKYSYVKSILCISSNELKTPVTGSGFETVRCECGREFFANKQSISNASDRLLWSCPSCKRDISVAEIKRQIKEKECEKNE